VLALYDGKEEPAGRVNGTVSEAARDVTDRWDAAMTSMARVNQTPRVVSNLRISGIAQRTRAVGGRQRRVWVPADSRGQLYRHCGL